MLNPSTVHAILLEALDGHSKHATQANCSELHSAPRQPAAMQFRPFWPVARQFRQISFFATAV